MSVRQTGDASKHGTVLAFRDASDEVRVQFGDRTSWVPRDQLEPLPAAPEQPEELLRSGRLSPPSTLRRLLSHVRLTGRLADVIYSLEATNTEFHAHQFKPVLRMLASPSGGLLIADEVGLGKTIEAGLIWKELEARFACRTLLVVCPKVLLGKWRAELSSKFDIDAPVLRASELLEKLQERARGGRGFAAICSIDSLRPPRGWDDENSDVSDRPATKLAQFLNDRRDDESLIDLLIVDESHHLRNPETQRHRFGQLVRAAAQYRVFLSATPFHLRNRDLHAQLRLLDPDQFQRDSDFNDLIQANRPIVAARDAVLGGRPVAEVAAHIEVALAHSLLAGNQALAAIIGRLPAVATTLAASERVRIADDLEDANLLSGIISRTRRRDVQELRIVRKVSAPVVAMSAAERDVYDAVTAAVQSHAQGIGHAAFLLAMPQRMLASSIPAALAHWRARAVDAGLDDADDDDADEAKPPEQTEYGSLVLELAALAMRLPMPQAMEAHDTKFDEVRRCVINYLTQNPSEKLIVFSSFKATLAYLSRRFSADGLQAAVIHGDIKDRDAVLAGFAADDGPRVLLSSEVGSEGLDLQFCRAIVNYDLPWNPMRVEQRIGRIDRMGQTADTVSVINVLHEDTIDRRIYVRLYERLGLCESALGSFEAVLGEEIRSLTEELLTGRLSPTEQDARIEQASQAIEKRKVDQDRLEAEAGGLFERPDRILQAIADARDLNRFIGPADLAGYVSDSLDRFYRGSELRELDSDLWELRLSERLRDDLADWMRAGHATRDSRLTRESGAIKCRFGRPAGTPRGVVALTQVHPLIRLLAQRTDRDAASRERPAVAAQISAQAFDGKIVPGRYLLAVQLWQFGGAAPQDRLAYAALNIDADIVLTADEAEKLAAATGQAERVWPDVAARLPLDQVAGMVEAKLGQSLDIGYREAQDRMRVSLQDRTALQLRALDQRFTHETGNLNARIERLRLEHKTRLIPALEGQLRTLGVRTEKRRAQIEAQRRDFKAERETLAVAVVEVE